MNSIKDGQNKEMQVERVVKIKEKAKKNLLAIKMTMENFEFTKMDNDEFVETIKYIMSEVETNYKVIQQIDDEINYLIEWCEGKVDLNG